MFVIFIVCLLVLLNTISYGYCNAIQTDNRNLQNEYNSNNNKVIYHRKLIINDDNTNDEEGFGNTTRKTLQDIDDDDEFIIIINDRYRSITNITATIETLGLPTGVTINFVYKYIFKGVSIKGLKRSSMIVRSQDDDKTTTSFLDNPLIQYVSTDTKVVSTAANFGNLRKPSKKINSTTIEKIKKNIFQRDDTTISKSSTVRKNSVRIQSNAPWNLDRIDQSSSTLNSKYKYTHTGAGVHVYVLDTGIRATHTEFMDSNGNSRVLEGFSAFPEENTKNGRIDLNGHGTHVAGIVGGKTYGVAKDVTLIPVQVLNYNSAGSKSTIFAGIDYVIGQKKANPKTPMIINLSVQGKYDQKESDAVVAAVTAGITVVVAAGNSKQDACNWSPALIPSAITVGSTTTTKSGQSQNQKDTISDFSNYGTCVDIFAPGSQIPSAWGTISDTDIVEMDGTSMAAPHVTGVVAMYLQTTPQLLPYEVFHLLNSTATKNTIVNLKDSNSPNRIVRSRRPIKSRGK